MIFLDLKTKKEISEPDAPLAIALGYFDGVHIGHAALISAMQEEARKKGLKTAVWTFTQPLTNTLSFVKKGPILTTAEEKLAIFRDLGLDYAIFVDFNAVRNLSPEDFVALMLRRQCRCELAVCGFNFRFGAGASGDAEQLLSLMKNTGGDAKVVPPVIRGKRIVSSSVIREFIENGDMESAADFLGRPFSIYFPVVRGNMLGRKIGIPTINQNFPPNHIIPRPGVYCCTCDVEGSIYLGVANIGIRPTISDEVLVPNCETHIIHYSGLLYGKKIKVTFYHRLRDEKKFDSIHALQDAVKKDIADTIAYFSDK